MTRNKLTIIYIASIGHSGSTLLDLLVSAHSEIVSVGEIINLRDYAWEKRSKTPNTPLGNECTCGADSINQCEFWQNVDKALRAETCLSLRDLEINASDTVTFEAHNLALFEALAKTTNKSVFLDSSKHPVRLSRLKQITGLNVLPIYLHRSEFGVVRSQLRKDEKLFRSCLGVVLQTYRLRQVMRSSAAAYVDYGALTADPVSVMQELMDQLNIPFEAGQLMWSRGVKHLVGGNRMRRSKSNEIRPDEDWRNNLSPLKKVIIATLTWPAMCMARMLRAG